MTEDKPNPYLKYFVRATQPKIDTHLFNENINSRQAYEEVIATTAAKASYRAKYRSEQKTGRVKNKIAEENDKTGIEHNIQDINNLLKAITHENFDTLEEMIKGEEFDINMKDNYLWTPLMCACHRGDIAIVDLLLNRGANINVTDTAGNTPVSIAKQCNHQEVYDLLVKRLNGDVKSITKGKQHCQENHKRSPSHSGSKETLNLDTSEDVIKLTESKDSKDRNQSKNDGETSKLDDTKFDSNEYTQIASNSMNTQTTFVENDIKNNKSEEHEIICISSSDSEVEQSTTYCPLCDMNVLDDNYKTHLLSTVHQFYKQLKAMESNEDKLVKPVDYAIPEENKGFQLLLKSGWTKQSGLGKDKSGIRAPIKTKMKIDRKGIGKQKQQLNNLHNVLPKHNVKFNLRLRKKIDKDKELLYRNELSGS
ncbi:hypothetical protein M8J77_005725 [Diaphorina citri]|nr:hypothetical protein M8J77_005725 [Diaphorina citri]